MFLLFADSDAYDKLRINWCYLLSEKIRIFYEKWSKGFFPKQESFRNERHLELTADMKYMNKLIQAIASNINKK